MLSEEEAKKLDEECMQRFLKINCKIVTRSKGCYDGVLIITPSAIMFDPIDSPPPPANTNSNTEFNADDSTFSSSELSHKVRTSSASSGNTIYDEASAIVPIEVISNVIMYEDLALKDVQEYFEYQETQQFLIETKNKQSQPSKVETIQETSELVDKQQETKEKLKSSSSSHRITFDLTQNEDDSIEVITNSNETIKKNESIVESSESVKSDKDCGEPTSDLKPNSDLISCYLCIKVNNNKDFLYCPLDRKMKNKLRSEFWFQIYDNRYFRKTFFFINCFKCL